MNKYAGWRMHSPDHLQLLLHARSGCAHAPACALGGVAAIFFCIGGVATSRVEGVFYLGLLCTLPDAAPYSPAKTCTRPRFVTSLIVVLRRRHWRFSSVTNAPGIPGGRLLY